MKILAIDYDGVICDSALKSLFIGHNVYCRYFTSRVKVNFGGELFTFNNWEEMKNRYKVEMDYYRQLRSYIEFSGDFFVIIKIIEEEIEIKNQQEFIHYRNQLTFDYHFFQEKFFKEKERWQKKDFEKWFFLSTVFKPVVQGIKKFMQEGKKVVIATSNRREYIYPEFQKRYLGFDIDIEDIFDKSFGQHKSEHMQAIAQKYGAKLNELYFVDDQLSYLKGTNTLGVNVFLAGWGYCTSGHINEAKKEKIRVIEEEEDFYPILKKFLN
ncbi:MAG: hypothetical protein Kow00103_12110 [Candidatus Caldatribacteriota bacterium]